MISELCERMNRVEPKIEDLFKYSQIASRHHRTVAGISAAEMLARISALEAQVQTRAGTEDLHQESAKLSALIGTVQTQLNEEIKGSHDDLAKIKSKLELLETKLAYAARALGDLQGKLGQPRGTTKPIPSVAVRSQPPVEAFASGAYISEDAWADMRDRVDRIDKALSAVSAELETFRELKRKYAEFEKRIDIKLDAKLFEDWRKENDLDELQAGIERRFADKADVEKMFKKLKMRLIMLEEMTTHEEPAQEPNSAGAMLAKKPLGGWSCASCQKNLVNMEAARPAYYPWARMPKKSLAERVAKVRLLETRWCSRDKGSRTCCRCSSPR